MRTICIYILILVLINCKYNEKLKFNDEGEFTILHFTDLHYGEAGDGDHLNKILIERIIQEHKPDLIVMTGDTVSGYGWDRESPTFFQEEWQKFTDVFKEFKIPYAYTMGNHDAQANLNRERILELDNTHDFSLMDLNVGGTNYHLSIYKSNLDDVGAKIWLLDTNEDRCSNAKTESWGCIEPEQIQWYEDESQKINDELGYTVQGLAFYHIPIPEYRDLYNNERTYGVRNLNINCPTYNTGFFDSMLRMNNIKATFAGHDHWNDIGGFYKGIELVLARKTGYGGGTGPDGYLKGAKVIKLKEKPLKGSFSYSHFGYLEDGSITQNSPLIWKGWLDYLAACVRE